MYNYKIDTYLKIILFVSLISIFSAFFIEYVLGHQPCNLCLIERIPYGLCIILIAINYFFNSNEKLMIFLLILIFLFSLIISFYHFGIERGFFEESPICKMKNSVDITSKEELLKQLQNKTISCKDVTFRVFGFSLTTINIAVSLILLSIFTKIFKDYDKFKKKS